MSASAGEPPAAGFLAHPRVSLICLVLGCATLLLYAPARHFDYVSFDDHAYTKPAHVQNGLTWAGLRWAFTTGHAANWHPLTWLSHMADVQLFGTGPAGPHLVNAALHAVNAVLVFVALRLLTHQTWPSAMVAALFAFHPLRVESVAWVSERKDLLSALFFLLTLIAYEWYARRGGAVAYVLALLAFAAGLLAKPMLVTLPFVLLLLDLWPLERTRAWRRLILEKVPFFVLALASSVITYIVQFRAGATLAEVVPLTLRLQNAILAYGRYLWTTIWPTKLAVFYPYLGALPGTKIPTAAVIASAIVLTAITVGALWMWRRNRAVLVGWLWFCGMLVPVIGLVQVGRQSMADRYTYLPHIGLFTAIVFGVWRLIPPRILATAVLSIAAALAYWTSVQLSTWRDTATLFTHALKVTTHNHVAHNNLAFLLINEGRREEAMEHIKRAIEINPRNRDPYYNLGLMYDELGQYGQAQSWYEQALERDPRYVEAHINLANVLLAQERLDPAIAHYVRAIELSPDSFLANYNLGLAMAQRDGDAAALPAFERAVRLSPAHAETRYSYAMSLRAAGREGEAREQFQHAAKLAEQQGLTDLLAEIRRRQNENSALPKPSTNPENQPR